MPYPSFYDALRFSIDLARITAVFLTQLQLFQTGLNVLLSVHKVRNCRQHSSYLAVFIEWHISCRLKLKKSPAVRLQGIIKSDKEVIMRGAKAVLFLLIAVLLIAPNLWAEEKVKVVYHFNSDDPKVHKAALINIQNHLDAEDGNVEIVAVSHGAGLSIFQEGKTEPDNFLRIRNLKKQGVKFKICSVTLKRQKIDIDTLKECGTEDVVKSGVAEIARLQQKGYAYIKP